MTLVLPTGKYAQYDNILAPNVLTHLGLGAFVVLCSNIMLNLYCPANQLEFYSEVQARLKGHKQRPLIANPVNEDCPAPIACPQFPSSFTPSRARRFPLCSHSQ